LDDHFPGSRGEVQAVLVRSPAMINCTIASLLASRAVLISAIGPPFVEECSGRSYSSSTVRRSATSRQGIKFPQTGSRLRWVRRPMALVRRAVADRPAAVLDGDTSA